MLAENASSWTGQKQKEVAGCSALMRENEPSPLSACEGRGDQLQVHNFTWQEISFGKKEGIQEEEQEEDKGDQDKDYDVVDMQEEMDKDEEKGEDKEKERNKETKR